MSERTYHSRVWVAAVIISIQIPIQFIPARSRNLECNNLYFWQFLKGLHDNVGKVGAEYKLGEERVYCIQVAASKNER